MIKVGYIRVSTTNQSIDRQVDQLKDVGCEKIFIDKMSGKTKDRPELKKMMDYLREGDVVVISELARLGRSLKDLLDIADEMKTKGVGLTSLKESIDYNTPEGNAMFQMLGVMAEFQRNIIADNVKQGLESARSRGRVGSLFICRYGIIYMTKGGGKNDFKASRKRTEIINGIHR